MVEDLRAIFDSVYDPGFDPSSFAVNSLKFNPITHARPGVRQNSSSFEGAGFGDEGKGRVVYGGILDAFRTHNEVIVYGWNGGANAGHVVTPEDGREMDLHQFSMGVLHPGAVSIVGRDQVFHPGDAIAEKANIVKMFGEMPGALIIDADVGLSLDTHRAWEQVVNQIILGYGGSTGRGIATAYADDLLRTKLTLKDLLHPSWRGKFGYHYDVVRKQIGPFGLELDAMKVTTLENQLGMKVGTRAEFLDRLEMQRRVLEPHVSYNVIGLLQDKWQDGVTPFIFEGKQAIGLHRKYGLYPDVSASETRARGIQDSTAGGINHQHIAGRFGVIKGPYWSSVGSRVLPGDGQFDLETAVDVRNSFFEFGRTTGRPRGITPPDLVALRFWRTVSDYQYLVVTHMDAGFDKIPIVVGYKDQAGKPVEYKPYQAHADFVEPEVIWVDGWDGAAAKKAKSPRDLPENALRFLIALEKALDTKIAYITTGPQYPDFVSWLPS